MEGVCRVENLHTGSLDSSPKFAPPFFEIRSASGFMAYFRFLLFNFLKIRRQSQISQMIAQNDQ